MKRRFRFGVELEPQEFTEQPWTSGMLELQQGALYLGVNGRSSKPEPAVLYRPTLKACFSGSISFLGYERNGRAMHLQIWYCETRSAVQEGVDIRKDGPREIQVMKP